MLSEKAKSRAQQRFFGMVRATQKGEMENPSPEITKVASTVSKSDVKKMASTKHKGLPEKKKVEEAAFLAGLAKGALAVAKTAGKGAISGAKSAVKQKAKQVVKQKAVNVVQGAIPQPNRDQQESVDVKKTEDSAQKKMNQIKKQVLLKKLQAVRSGGGETVTASHHPEGEMIEGVGRAAIGAGVGAMVGGPVGAAAGAAIGASLGKKKVTTGGNKVKKKATNFFKAEPKVTSSEGVVAFVKKGLERDKKAKKEKDIKNRKAVPYAALAAEHQPEGEELKEYSPNVTYQDKKKGKLGKSSIYSLRDKDESKKDFRKSHVKDVEDGYVGKGHKPTPGSLKKEDWKPEIIHSKMGDAKKKKDKEKESKLPPHLQGDAIGKMRKAFADTNEEVQIEAKVDQGLDDETKENVRNYRRFGTKHNQHKTAVLRRSLESSKRGEKKVKGEKQQVESVQVVNEISLDTANKVYKARKDVADKVRKVDPKEASKNDEKAIKTAMHIARKERPSFGDTPKTTARKKSLEKLVAKEGTYDEPNLAKRKSNNEKARKELKKDAKDSGYTDIALKASMSKGAGVSEGVMDIVNRYKKKKEEKKPQKAQDAGARARRVLKRREYQSKVSPFVPAELEDQKVWDKIKKYI